MALSRRTLLAGAGTAAAAAAAGAAVYMVRRKEEQAAPGGPRVRLVVGADNSASRTVMWEGKKSAGLELRGPDGSVRTFEPVRAEHRSGETLFHLNEVRLEGLQPGGSYAYRIPGVLGDWTPFRTAGRGATTALLFPDSQSTDRYETWRQLYQEALRREPQADFTAHMGDLVDCGAWLEHWYDWFAAVKGGIERVPAAPVMGNHDTYDQNARIGMPENFLAAFAPPENGSADWQRWYYAFDSGPVRFLVVNTEWPESDSFRPGLLPEMKRWFREASKTSQPWKVVLMHRSAVANSIRGRKPRGPFSEAGRELMPLFDEAGVDLVVTAHLHTYRRRGHVRGFRRDASGPLYVVSGVAGNIRYNDFWIDSPLDEFVAPQPETDNYLVLRADASSLELASRLPDGSLIDRSVLRKA
ncbi:metallophosphoesterase family protein [Mesosutterella sp. AGMB02718]|uniref:Metallophosphoesterase family protein n=1 Tax=Mesosutterella faecium TaxID=2925194 RepID=A0ABT7IPG1_9BURK|nr:metallophosphoesterase family protein [Mesosutterella sp. AGMB02718]MDL2060283.1 metallophosphoesterase family protein [Mesosutterella sp. AGMB02718]